MRSDSYYLSVNDRRTSTYLQQSPAACERTLLSVLLLALSRTEACVTSLLLRLWAPTRLRHLLTSFLQPVRWHSAPLPRQAVKSIPKTLGARAHTRTHLNLVRLVNRRGWKVNTFTCQEARQKPRGSVHSVHFLLPGQWSYLRPRSS